MGCCTLHCCTQVDCTCINTIEHLLWDVAQYVKNYFMRVATVSPEVAPLHSVQWSTIILLHDMAAVIGCTAQADCMYVDTAWTLSNAVNSVNSLYADRSTSQWHSIRDDRRWVRDKAHQHCMTSQWESHRGNPRLCCLSASHAMRMHGSGLPLPPRLPLFIHIVAYFKLS